ncbi:MAG: nucleotide exchange factor GrpE [Bacteroidales bacterium]|jgi:molecular chaperone GrpE|nr:nucleotide exchange factor GrpE [Bacteroidales bacterium]
MEKNNTNKQVKEKDEVLENKAQVEQAEDSKEEEKKATSKPKSNSAKKPKKKTENKKDKQLRELQERVDELSEKYIRLSAEFDNYRKRTLKEKMELSKNAGKQIFENLLPVIDDLERAIEVTQNAEDIDAVKEGMVLIHSKFLGFLRQQGVSEMDSVGKDFDTDEHEAVTKIPAPEESMKGKVVDVITKGYKIKDQILRYSKVVVGE